MTVEDLKRTGEDLVEDCSRTGVKSLRDVTGPFSCSKTKLSNDSMAETEVIDCIPLFRHL